MKSVQKITVWLICLSLGLTLFNSGSLDVLCISQQGDFKIEPAHIESCCEIEHSLPINDFDADDFDLHQCTDCSDIPIDPIQLWQSQKITKISKVKFIATYQFNTLLNLKNISDLSSKHNFGKSNLVWLEYSISKTSAVLLC